MWNKQTKDYTNTVTFDDDNLMYWYEISLIKIDVIDQIKWNNGNVHMLNLWTHVC